MAALKSVKSQLVIIRLVRVSSLCKATLKFHSSFIIGPTKLTLTRKLAALVATLPVPAGGMHLCGGRVQPR